MLVDIKNIPNKGINNKSESKILQGLSTRPIALKTTLLGHGIY